MIFAHITHLAVLAFSGLAAWWLSGYDSKLTGANKKGDSIRRAIRCGITLPLVAMFFGLSAAGEAMLLALIIGGMLALIWCGCIAELFARWFHHLVDPPDKREFDPNKGLRDLDMIANLIKNGRREEAVQLCQMLKESGAVSILALETTLEHLGVKQESVQKPKPLTEAYHLRMQGRFQEAESILKPLLAEDPRNVDAAMMLMRVYAQDLHRPHKAMEILQALEKQPYISPAHVEFARRSIGEWSHAIPRPEKVDAPPESIDELLVRGCLGTVIEVLEQKIKEQAGDFDLRIKLAEVHALHCGNVHQAGKIVQKIEARPGWTICLIDEAGFQFDI